jgi:DNA-binding response OmpR family regulator
MGARVSALLRRLDTGGAPSCFVCGPLAFDFDAMRFEKAGVALELSKTEQRLLKLLTANAGRTMSRQTLIEKVWKTAYIDENALSVTIRRLREKLEADPGSPVFLRTVYGIGYVWTTDSAPGGTPAYKG